MGVVINLSAEYKRAWAAVHTDRLGSIEDDCVFMEATESSWMRQANKLRDDIMALQQTLRKIEEKEQQRQRSMFNEVLAAEIQTLSINATKQIEALQAGVTTLSMQSVEPNSDDSMKRGIIGSLFASIRRETQKLQSIQQRYVALLGVSEGEAYVQRDSYDSMPTVIHSGLQLKPVLTHEEIQLRQKEISHITAGISEIASIVSQMSAYVYEQGTVLDRIDANVYTAVSYAVAGKDVLKKVHTTQKRMRWCTKITYFIIAIDYGLLLLYLFLRVF